MSSGQKHEVYNTRERLLSTDFNRAQAFQAADLTSIFARMMSDFRQNYLIYPGVSTPRAAVETPLAATVIAGLMVQPGTTSLTVQAGLAFAYSPDPSATTDDSPVILINDPGLQTLGVLTFAANGGGGPRLDIVECQPTDTLLESDNRDVFDPATGLFVPSTVPKVKAFRMTYRIRAGTPGGGLPAMASGWLPLAVVCVPVGATDFTGCDFWDVRPLAEDRVRSQPGYDLGGSLISTPFSPVRNASYFTSLSSGHTQLFGYSESQWNGYLAGGWLRRSTAYVSGGTRTGTGSLDGDPDFVTLDIADNQTSGFALANNKVIYLGAFFPGALPRWVRYSQSNVSPFGRIPKGPRGILLLTDAAPLPNGLFAPLAIGGPFTASSPGVCLAAWKATATGAIGAYGGQDGWHRFINSIGGSNGITTTALSTLATWAPVAGTDYPANATELLAYFELQFSGGTGHNKVEFGLADSTGVLQQTFAIWAPATENPGGFPGDTFRVPLYGIASPGNAGGPTSKIVANATSGTFNTGTNLQLMKILAWRLG